MIIPLVRHRIITVLALAAAATRGAVGLTANPAGASVPQFPVRVAPLSNLFLTLDAAGASTDNGTPIVQWVLNGGSNQVWSFVHLYNLNANEIVGSQSGKCVTTDGVAGDAVYLSTCNESWNQLWLTEITANDGSPYLIQSRMTGNVLEVNGASISQGAFIDTWPFNGGTNQYFLATRA